MKGAAGRPRPWGVRAASQAASRGRTRAAAAPACAAIATDRSGRNQIIVAPSANLLARADQLPDSWLGPSTILLLQMEVDLAENEAVIRRARARGARILLNLAPAAPVPSDLLRALDFLVVNEDEAATVAAQLSAKDDAAALQRILGITVVRTLGAAGAEVASAAERFHVPALKIDPIDSTAAGDCFTGVFAAALDSGATLRGATTRAIAAAGLACTRSGSQGSLPSSAEIDRALPG